MKKKLFLLFGLVILLVGVTGCASGNEASDSMKFKEEYESLNGTENSSGKEHRTVTIAEDNPFVYVPAEDIIEKIENNETFYVYFGSKLCPWCRSTIEKVIEVAKNTGVDTIYYVDIWDDDGKEILRDTYVLENDALKLKQEGTDSYYKLLEYFDNVLLDYTLSDGDGNVISVNEKRIYAPFYIYVENGEAIRSTNATSSKQQGSRDELTAEILEDEENILKEFFLR